VLIEPHPSVISFLFSSITHQAEGRGYQAAPSQFACFNFSKHQLQEALTA
jgi:hypothetical protein